MPTMTGGHAIVQALKAEGVDVVFGLPGVQIMQLYDGFFGDSDIRVISTRHEQATVYMADGYARSTGKIGVALVVPGPGLYNACAALATAYSASSPVLLICGQVDSSQIGKEANALHQVHDQLDIVRPVTKWSHRVMRLQEIPEIMHEAMRQLRTGRPRPVEIEVPPDILAARGDVEILEPGKYTRPEGDSRAVSAAADLLAGARNPVILAGGGVIASEASTEMVVLAERLNAPILTTPEGRGVISDAHPLAMGLMTTFGGMSMAPDLVPQADVILAVGTRFGIPTNAPWFPKNAKLVHIDIDPKEFGRVQPPTVAVEADAKSALRQLSSALATRKKNGVWKREDFAKMKASAQSAGRAAMPQYYDVYQEMRKVVGPEGIFLSGITGLAYGSNGALPVYRPRTWITSSYMGTLGYEFSTALGAKVGNPDKPVVAMVGDGGFMYSVGELATAVQYGINLVTIVYNNHVFGASNQDQRVRIGGRVVGTELHNPNFSQLAESFGAKGMYVKGLAGLPQALAEALKANKPVLIEVDVEKGEMPINLYQPGAPVPPPARG